jgi:hypothetical protein
MERVSLNGTVPRRKPGNPAWHKGMRSANPTGRPKTVHEVVMLARQHAPAAIRKLYEIMTTANDPATQLAATTALLDRGFGKPFQAVAISELPPIDVNIDASMDPVMAAAAWARMIGSDTPRQRARRIKHQPAEDDLTQRLKQAISNE